MATKYFKKLIPKTKVVLESIKATVQFQTIDGLVGFRATSNEQEIQDYYKFMRQQRYGITEISEEEYTRDFSDKKKAVGSTQLPSWSRETVGEAPSRPTSPLRVLPPDAVRAAIGIEGKSDIRMEDIPVDPLAPPASQSPQGQSGAPLTLGKRPTMNK